MAKILNIGRSANNEIIINESYISAQHAQLMSDDDMIIYINDLGSVNGTFVNGVRIYGSQKIQFGDTIVLGSSKFNWESYFPGIQNSAKIPQQMSSLKTYGLSALTALIIVLAIFGMNELRSSSVDHEKSEKAKNGKSKKGGDNASNEKNVKVPKEITYDFSCVVSEDNREASDATDILDEMRTGVINAAGVEVSVQEEMAFGDQNHDELLQGSTVIQDDRSDKLEQTLRALVLKIDAPRGFDYKIFLIQSDQINAWTCGGRIYFTTTMFAFTETNDEIAGIIGHEIYHNELGHINKMLKAQKISEQTFGPDFGGIASTIDGIMRSPFGKKDEAHCDFKGADLCIKTNYESCDIVELWERMSQNQGESDALTEFLSSHPLSSQRRDCLKNHLRNNYQINCEN
jgi:hypothetical protein